MLAPEIGLGDIRRQRISALFSAATAHIFSIFSAAFTSNSLHFLNLKFVVISVPHISVPTAHIFEHFFWRISVRFEQARSYLSFQPFTISKQLFFYFHGTASEELQKLDYYRTTTKYFTAHDRNVKFQKSLLVQWIFSIFRLLYTSS